MLSSSKLDPRGVRRRGNGDNLLPFFFFFSVSSGRAGPAPDSMRFY